MCMCMHMYMWMSCGMCMQDFLPRRRAGTAPAPAAATPAAVSAAWSMGADGTRVTGLSPSMASALTVQPKTMHLVEHLLAQGASR